MLEALFAAAAEAVFSYILDTLEPAERLRDWLKRNPVKLAYQHALARTYAAFARQYPEFTASLFNESFLTIEAAPELAKFLIRHQHPDHTQLVRLWAKSITPQTEAGQQSIEALSKREDLNAASAYFVELLTAELKRESALQPLFDSRALESLPAIEAKLDQLTNALKQAMMVANNYEQTVVNRSGGVDFQAQQVTVGGDVVGRDKIVDNSIRVGNITGVQAVAIGHGAHALVTNNYFTGDFVTLDDLYIRPDAVFQRVRVHDFVGREWLTAKVDHFLNDEKYKSGVFLLVGEAGVGKTSFLAHLVTERRYLHVFAEQVPGDVNVSRALQSLGAQLVARYRIDPYKEKGTLPAIATFPDFLDKLLRLAADKLSAGEKIVIVCDALDEAGTAPNGNVFGLPSVLPDGVYFILSQRPVATVKLSVKADLVKETIDAAGTDNLHDVEQYLTAVSRRPEIANQLRAKSCTESDFVRILKERSGGVWMYLFYVVSEIAAGSRAPLDLATLPTGLAGYYTDYWGDWSEGRNGCGEGLAKWDAVYASLLATLAAAQLPITLKLLLAWSKVQANEYEVERLLRRNWRAFISEREIDHTPHFALYHASLRDFLTGQVNPQGLAFEAEQLIDELSRRTDDAHARIVEYYRQQCNGDWVKLVDDDYACTNLCLHLSASGNGETMYQLVAMSNAWAEAKYAKEESYAGYLVDLNRAWQYAETGLHWNIGQQIRCALIESTVHTLTDNLSPELLQQVVETKRWTVTRAFEHVTRMTDAVQQADAIARLAASLPDELKSVAIDIVRKSPDDGGRALALGAMARALSGDVQNQVAREAFEAAERTKDWNVIKPVLLALTDKTPDSIRNDVIRKVLPFALQVQDKTLWDTLAGLLSPDLILEALEICRKRTWQNMDALFALARVVRGDLTAQMWSLVRETLRGSYPLGLLVALIENASDSLKSEMITQGLETRLPLWLGPEDPQLLSRLIVTAPPDWQAKLAEYALTILRKDKSAALARELGRIANDLPEALQHQVGLDLLSSIHALIDMQSQDADLATIVKGIPADLRDKALEIVRTIPNQKMRAESLIAIAEHAPEALRGEITSKILTVAHMASRRETWADRLKYLPMISWKLIEEIRYAIFRIDVTDIYARAQILAELVRIAPQDLKSEVIKQLFADISRMLHSLFFFSGDAFKILGSVPEEFYTPAVVSKMLHEMNKESLGRAPAERLVKFVGVLPSRQRIAVVEPALAAIQNISRADERLNLLNEMIEVAPPEAATEIAQKAMVAVRQIRDWNGRVRYLQKMYSSWPQEHKSLIADEGLVMARRICDRSERTVALSKLSRALPDDLQRETFEMASKLGDINLYTESLANLARAIIPSTPSLLKQRKAKNPLNVPLEDLMGQALLQVVDRLKSLSCVLEDDIHAFCQATILLVHTLPDDWKEEIWLMVETYLENCDSNQSLAPSLYIPFDNEEIIQNLLNLADVCPNELKMKIYELIRRNSSYAEVRVSVFNKMAELPISESTASVLVELELAVNANPSGNWRANETRAQILVSWAKWLPDELKIEALEAIRQVSDDEKRAEMLTKLVRVVPADLRVGVGYEALEAVKKISGISVKRPVALVMLAQALPATMKDEALLMARSFEGRERAQALIGLADLWPESSRSLLIGEALAAAYAEKDYWNYIEALCEMASVLPEGLKTKPVRDALDIVRHGYFDLVRADFLCRLASVAPEELKAEIVDEALIEVLELSDKQKCITLLTRLATIAPAISRSKVVSHALVNAAAIQGDDRTGFFTSLATSWAKIKILPPDDYQDIWPRALHLLATHQRSTFLADLSALQPIIEQWEGRASLVALAYATHDVGTWWP